MNQQSSRNSNSFVINKDGAKCFTFGKTKIKVIEYFAEQGKQLSQLLAELVLQEVRKLEENPA